MRFSVIALTALLGFSGCSQKGAFDLFNMDTTHERAIEELRVGTIVQSFETKAIFSSLYLNKIDPQTYRGGEYFIAAIYFEKDNRLVKKLNIEEYGYHLALNGKAPTIIEPLSDQDLRRRLMPVQNNWNRYYLIRFDSVPESILTLQLENNQIGSVVLNYQK